MEIDAKVERTVFFLGKEDQIPTGGMGRSDESHGEVFI